MKHSSESVLEILLQRQSQSWQAGRPLLVEDLLKSAASDGIALNVQLDDRMCLICNEVVLREQAGERPTLPEYQQRFPDLHHELQLQWEIDELMDTRDTNLSTTFGNVTPEESNPPDRIDRYEIRRELGRGAMGIVYEAFDSQLKRTLALKRLRSGIDADPVELLRMRTEAETIAQLQHPHIVRIYDIGEERGLPYLAMEYCSGGTLVDRLAGHPLDPGGAARLVMQIADGVALAHSMRIIHRDLKPGNVLLENTTSLIPRVADFGLARILDYESTATATGSLLGSPAYMAPEQAYGESKHVGPSADVYALGAILYECLTGRPPFSGATIADTLEQVRQRDPVRVRQLVPKVPVDLETIAHKCLRKNPQDRYESAAAVVDDLQRFLDRRPILARRESWIEAGLRVIRRHPAVALLTATAILWLIVLAVGSSLFAQRLNRELKRSELAERQALEGQAEALVGRAHGIRLSGRPGQRFEALKAIRQAVQIGHELKQPDGWYAALRDEAIAALCLPDLDIEEFRSEADEVFQAVLCPDQTRYAIVLSKGDIQIRDAQTHSLRITIPWAESGANLEFVDNEHLLVQSPATASVALWSVESATPQQLWQTDGGCWYWNVSRDRQRLAIVDPHQLQVIELPSGRQLAKQAAAPFSREAMVVLHPTAPLVLLHSYFNSEVQVRNWQTNEVVAVVEPDKGTDNFPGYSGADWLPDGRRFVVAGGHEDSMHWYSFDVDRGIAELHHSIKPEPETIVGGGPTLISNALGDRLIKYGWNRSSALIDADTGSLIARSQPTPSVNTIRRTPMKSNVGFFRHPDHSDQVGLMSLAEGYEWRILSPAGGSEYGHAVFDPQGKFIFACSERGLEVLDARTQQLLATTNLTGLSGIRLHCDTVNSLFVATDGTSLYWPYRITENDTIRMEIGIPRRSHLPARTVYSATSRHGDVLVASLEDAFGTQFHSGCWLKQRHEPAPRRLLGECSGKLCAVSPDGQSAIVELAGSGRLWIDCSSGSVTRQQDPAVGRPRFSQDGQWWIAGGKGRTRTGSSTPPPDLPSGTSHDLSSDGKILLTFNSVGVIGLVSAESNTTLAQIDGPRSCVTPVFSPCGDRILCHTSTDELVLIDLRRIRKGLSDLGLDWEAPTFPDEPAADKPLEVVFAPELSEISSMNELLDLIDRQAIQNATINPEDGFAAFDAAMAAIRNHQMPTAVELLDRACELLPDAITPRLWRAYTLGWQREYASAVAEADRVLQRISDPDLCLLKAEWLYHQQKYAAAIETCTEVIEASPSNRLLAYALRGECHAQLGNMQQAGPDSARLINYTTDIRSLHSICFSRVGYGIPLCTPRIALLLADKLLANDPAPAAEYFMTIGLAYYRNDRWQQAVEYFQRNLDGLESPDALSVTELMSLYGLALSHSKLGHTEESREYLERAESCQLHNVASPLDMHYIHPLRQEIKELRKSRRGVTATDVSDGQSSQ